MKRIFALVATLAVGAALGGLVSQLSPTARTVLPSKGVPEIANKTSATAGPSPAASDAVNAIAAPACEIRWTRFSALGCCLSVFMCTTVGAVAAGQV